jgi:hypothetical protein
MPVQNPIHEVDLAASVRFTFRDGGHVEVPVGGSAVLTRMDGSEAELDLSWVRVKPEGPMPFLRVTAANGEWADLPLFTAADCFHVWSSIGWCEICKMTHAVCSLCGAGHVLAL